MAACAAFFGVPAWLAGCGGLAREPAMTRERLEALVVRIGKPLGGEPGAVGFEFDGVGIVCASDLEYDRMRLVAPVLGTPVLQPRDLAIVLSANYYTTLDARYALSQGRIFAVYLHPLSSLDEAQLRSAIEQVANLVKNYGKSYSSGGLEEAPAGGAPL
jgi:hypothetical protein